MYRVLLLDRLVDLDSHHGLLAGVRQSVHHGSLLHLRDNDGHQDQGVVQQVVEDLGQPRGYPLVNKQKANWKMSIEIVDLPIRNCDFPWLC